MRTNLTKAFAELRKNGYFAKQNFLCCQSCGWAALSDEEAKNAVFYHNQDYRDFKKIATYTLLGRVMVTTSQKL
jgi:hypothetical protein